MRSTAPLASLAVLVLAAASCGSPAGQGLSRPQALALVASPPAAAEPPPRPSPADLARERGVELTRPGASSVQASWKERVAEPYVFLEVRGDRSRFGAAMRRLFEVAAATGVEATGPPFGLFQPDGEGELARACLPVAAPAGGGVLGYDVLPRALVAYAVVAGAYPEAPRVRAGLVRWMAERGWEQRGPVREIYLVDPRSASDLRELACEVQIPWAPGG